MSDRKLLREVPVRRMPDSSQDNNNGINKQEIANIYREMAFGAMQSAQNDNRNYYNQFNPGANHKGIYDNNFGLQNPSNHISSPSMLREIPRMDEARFNNVEMLREIPRQNPKVNNNPKASFKSYINSNEQSEKWRSILSTLESRGRRNNYSSFIMENRIAYPEIISLTEKALSNMNEIKMENPVFDEYQLNMSRENLYRPDKQRKIIKESFSGHIIDIFE